MEYNDEKNVNTAPDYSAAEEPAEMQDEIRFFADEPDEATEADAIVAAADVTVARIFKKK